MTAILEKTGVECNENKDLLAQLVTRLGHPSAIILLDNHYQIFKIPEVEGFIGYRAESHCAIAISDPVCSEKDIPRLTEAFHNYCKEKNWKVLYMVVSEDFRKWALDKVCQASIEIGEEFIVDPAEDPTKGRKGEKLRYKVHRAALEGVKIKEYIGENKELEEKINKATQKWVKGRKGPQIYFADVDTFTTRFGKRWFYAMKDDEIVGVILINRIDRYNGWVLNVQLTTPEAPMGTSEALIMHVVETLRQENCRYFSIGAGTGNNLGEVVGLGFISSLIARSCFRMANWFFHLYDRKHFLKKFQPHSCPSYMLFSDSKIGYHELLALKKSLNVSLKND